MPLQEERNKALQDAIAGAKLNLRNFEGLVPGAEKVQKLNDTVGLLNAEDQQQHFLELREGIAQYTAAAQLFRELALKRRQDRIGYDFRIFPPADGFIRDFLMRDKADGSETVIRVDARTQQQEDAGDQPRQRVADGGRCDRYGPRAGVGAGGGRSGRLRQRVPAASSRRAEPTR